MLRLHALVLVLLVAAPAGAQVPPDSTLAEATPLAPEGEDPILEGLDARLLRAVYTPEAPLFAAAMLGVEWSSAPVYFVAPLASYAVGEDGERWRPATRMAAAEALALGTAVALKRTFARRRPYDAMRGVTPRSGGLRGRDPHSFPSGHTALAFAVAATAAGQEPRWYVIAPAAVWASAVGLARVRHGVHFPSDVLAGAVLGTGAGVLAHVLLPARSGEDEEERTAPVFVFRLAF